ncbi:hypothetical protein KFU94_10005 [Chloroflexi bacterium TSY]|nr:hypothetical protein [Chloroflexi bacterium TSY]
MRDLKFLFQEPGLIEAVAFDPNMPPPADGLNTSGYRSLWVADLMVDYDPRIERPYAFMISSFHKTYPLVIWALKIHMNNERFNVPQAGLSAIPLHEAFSWAYTHFIMDDYLPEVEFNQPIESANFSTQVLQYAALV